MTLVPITSIGSNEFFIMIDPCRETAKIHRRNLILIVITLQVLTLNPEKEWVKYLMRLYAERETPLIDV